MTGDPIGDVIIQRGLVPESVVQEAIIELKMRGGRLGELLTAKKLTTEEAIAKALAEDLGMGYAAAIDDREIPDDLIRTLPINFAKQRLVLPRRRTPEGIEVYIADPFDTPTLDEMSVLMNDTLIYTVAAPNRVIDAINKVYDRGTAHAEAAMEDLKNEDLSAIESDIEDIIDIIDSEDEAPIIRLVNSILSQATKEHASDIHVEPFERDMSVRFRIDGVLYEKIKPPKKLQASITSRLKIMAGLNIAEKRLPQDGRIRIKLAGRDIDIRVATAPTVFGERITMRLLDRSSILLDLTDLGFAPDIYKQMESLVHKSYGIILVTGPTGSGKTTTLYACLNRINSPELNILTVEDPVEYQLQGISQVQVNAKIDLTFANGLRSFLRHDPDVIMVGEIRDRDTAEIAIQASLTGHLVLSTVHTNDASGAITRLADMGIEPFLVASSLIGVLAQRLIRTVCPDCKEAYQPSEEALREIGVEVSKLNSVPTIFRGKGCQKCVFTGYRGRSGIYELMPIDDEIRERILQKVDAGSIKKSAVKHGMRTLREDGAKKVLAGLTTIEEVLSVTQEDN
ncbi:MAG: type II secretion system ATPase GspE [Deltaproteobacteria bacterium]|nr:type II secretion system ATPase GspE [Deltaproteobacteria bacterium]